MKLALTVLFMVLALCLVMGEKTFAWEDPNEGTGFDGGGGTDQDDHPWGGDGLGGNGAGGDTSATNNDNNRNISVAATVDKDPLDWLYEKFTLIKEFYFWKFDIRRFDDTPTSNVWQAGSGNQITVGYPARSSRGRLEK